MGHRSSLTFWLIEFVHWPSLICDSICTNYGGWGRVRQGMKRTSSWSWPCRNTWVRTLTLGIHSSHLSASKQKSLLRYATSSLWNSNSLLSAQGSERKNNKVILSLVHFSRVSGLGFSYFSGTGGSWKKSPHRTNWMPPNGFLLLRISLASLSRRWNKTLGGVSVEKEKGVVPWHHWDFINNEHFAGPPIIFSIPST